jgi:hypothetical protein
MNTVKLFGQTCAAIQKHGLENPGRLWALMRHIDRRGSGRLPVTSIRTLFTTKESELYCKMGWARVRQLLAKGENIFWHRSTCGEWLHYHSEARVLYTLNDQQALRVTGWAIALPVNQLTAGITAVRALFYDAGHSGRAGDGDSKPIARQTITEHTQVERRTQRKYEQKRGVGKKSNFAIISRYSIPTWQQVKAEEAESYSFGESHKEHLGGPAFVFNDVNGECSPANTTPPTKLLICRQIGNSYNPSLPTVKRSRKHLQQKLAHLSQSQQVSAAVPDDRVGSQRKSKQRLYYEHMPRKGRLHTHFVFNPHSRQRHVKARFWDAVNYWLE